MSTHNIWFHGEIRNIYGYFFYLEFHTHCLDYNYFNAEINLGLHCSHVFKELFLFGVEHIQEFLFAHKISTVRTIKKIVSVFKIGYFPAKKVINLYHFQD